MPLELTKQEQINFDIVRDYIDSYISQSRYAKSVEFLQSDDEEENNYLEAIINCGGYYATITYKTWSFGQGNLYMNICFSGCDYRFKIYDIFNLYNIEDFNIYDFDNCIEKKSITDALDKLTALIEKYSVDIRNADNNRSIAKLMKNRKHDIEVLFHGNAEESDLVNGDFSYVAKYHRMSKDKAISKLKAKSNRITVYEKRLLDYLSRGNEIEASTGCELKKLKTTIYTAIWLISVIAVGVIYFLVKTTVFGRHCVTVHFDNSDILPDYIFDLLISWVGLAVFLIFYVGKPLIVYLCSKEQKDIARAKFNFTGNIKNRLITIITPVIALVVSAAMIYMTTSGIGFNDKQLVVNYGDSFTANYSEITVYQVDVWVNDNGGISYSDDEYYYIIKYGQDKLYDVPVMFVDSHNGKTFTEQLEKHNVEIIHVQSPNSIPIQD